MYAMHFRGQASRSGAEQAVLRTTASGASSTMRTRVSPDGVETSLEPAEGDLAFLEVEMRLTSREAFEGKGTLTFGDEGDHGLRFTAAGPGCLAPGAAPNLMAGAVIWRIEGGDGRFAGATGFIASSFTLGESGDLNEYHSAILFLPA
jgi:hypothetical protein